MSSVINQNRNVCNEVSSFLGDVDREKDFHVAFFVTSFEMEQRIKHHIFKNHEEESFGDCKKQGRKYSFVNINGNLDMYRGMKTDYAHIYLSISDMKKLSSNQSAIAFQLLLPALQCENVKTFLYVDGKLVTPRKLMGKLAELI